MLTLTENQLNPNGYWSNPITHKFYNPRSVHVDLFDQNGYDLTLLEQIFADENGKGVEPHRYHRAIKRDWFTQEEKNSGAILNHSLLFERKAYSGEALEQLKRWADKLPIFHKVIAMRPKWGLDFSIDYVDQDGNAFEVLHWEYDGFDFDEVNEVKLKIEPILASIDYDEAAQELLNLKDQWHSLDFFGQSDWKCKFFGIPRERFKMVIWE